MHPFSGYTWNVLLENFEVIYHYCYVESLGSENMNDLVNFECNQSVRKNQISLTYKRLTCPIYVFIMKVIFFNLFFFYFSWVKTAVK